MDTLEATMQNYVGLMASMERQSREQANVAQELLSRLKLEQR